MDESVVSLESRLTVLETKVDAIFVSVEKTRKIMLWTGIITIAVIIVPLLIMPFLLPAFLAGQGVSMPGL